MRSTIMTCIVLAFAAAAAALPVLTSCRSPQTGEVDWNYTAQVLDEVEDSVREKAGLFPDRADQLNRIADAVDFAAEAARTYAAGGSGGDFGDKLLAVMNATQPLLDDASNDVKLLVLFVRDGVRIAKLASGAAVELPGDNEREKDET